MVENEMTLEKEGHPLKKGRTISAVLALLLALAPFLGLVSAAEAGGLTVTGGKIDAVVKPGEDYVYTMEVKNTSNTPLDISVESKGYGTAGDSSFVVLEPVEDKSLYSAREFLAISPGSFHLECGDSQTITVSASIPPGIGDGGRYAIVFIHTTPQGGTVATVSAMAARVLLTIGGSRFTHNSKIMAIEPGAEKPGTVLVSVANTGNHHYKPHLNGQLKSGDKVLAVAEADDVWPLIPGYGRQLEVSFSGSERIPAGEYEVDIDVLDDSGGLVAQQTSSLNIESFDAASSAPPLPPSGQTAEPAPASIILSPAGAATLATQAGEIAVSFPPGAVISQAELSLTGDLPGPLPDLPLNCTSGSTCFRVEGLNGLLLKEATVKVKFSAADLEKAEGDASRLALARWDEDTGRWTILETKVDEDEMTLTASTTRFSTWAVIIRPPKSGFFTAAPPLASVGTIVVVAAVAIASMAAIMVWRRRRQSRRI